MALLDNFTKDAKDVLEEAVKLADKDKCPVVYTIHVVLAAYSKEEKLTENLVGASKADFIAMYNDMIKVGDFPLSTSNDKHALNIEDNSHRELKDVLVCCENVSKELYYNISLADILCKILSEKTYTKSALILYKLADKRSLEQLRPLGFEYPQLSGVCRNLTLSDRLNGYNSLSGRDKELDKLIETLCRYNKRNALLIGDAGVGKTAIVRKLSQRIASGDVPEQLKGKIVLEVDMSAVVSGAQFRGMFEQKFNQVLYMAESLGNAILFFDEMHTLMRVGDSSENGNTAANMLKPAIAGHCFPIIGATTVKEYNKHIERDEAINRRFETILVDELNESETVECVYSSIEEYESFHGVRVPKEVIEYAVKLSNRYIKDKYQPDKAFTVIDQACTAVKLSTRKSKRLTKRDVDKTVSNMTGIEVSELSLNELKKLRELEKRLTSQLIGQDDAVREIVSAIKRNRSGISAGNKPIGTFLFVGPSGVGKTELCKLLSKEFGTQNNNLIRIDMSEYMEKSSVSKLIGSAPGYVGYGDGGQLTSAVSRNPYSIVLLDEIEKAHKDVYNILLQLLDDGRLTDGTGKTVDFCNTIVVMTSNIGHSSSIEHRHLGFGPDTVENDTSRIREEIEKEFRPEFLNRLDKIVVFNSLSRENSKKIASLMLDKLSKRLVENQIYLKFDAIVLEDIVDNGFDEKYGARNLNRYIQDTIEAVIAEKFISGKIKKNTEYRASISNGVVEISQEHKGTNKATKPSKRTNRITKQSLEEGLKCAERSR